MVANISRPNNFESLTAAEWLWICDEIKKDYKYLSYAELEYIVKRGIKGHYNESQFNINARTIFQWVESWKDDERRKTGK